MLLGKGTNTLVSDKGFDGVVVLTENLNRIFVRENRILCESGAKISALVKTAVRNSLGGIEFLAGIPGTVGGALISNAGLKNTWISQIVGEVYVLSPDNFEIKNIGKEEASFGYRKSGLEKFFIYRAVLILNKSEKGEIKKNVRSNMEKRIAKQPIESCSAGSVFKNPEGAFAGELIEKAGLKGYCAGGAKISTKHSNFIINTGTATSQDIYAIIKTVQKKVKDIYNIELEPEIKIIGDFER